VSGVAAGLANWNTVPPGAAQSELLTCCASPAWARAVAAGRPYPDIDAVLRAGADALAALPWSEIELALRAHPRIGHRADGGGREAAWSRREQAGAREADPATAAALVRANQAYEQRFGHVFLIFATGRTAGEMLVAARTRLSNDPATERAVVRAELCKIARLRLERLLGS
jgi:2-oxo-4-hydroxy-4-carboxy-5-ureidoimidazoline decarboxylase